MKIIVCLACASVTLAATMQASDQCHRFTHEHVDLLSVQWDAAESGLGLMAADDTHGALYASNQCVVVCPESMKFLLPGGTPLGNEGDSLWILPQNPYEGTPYVGVSAEAISSGTFNDPFTIQLTRLEGPGQFLVWQAGGFGGIDLKMDTRDGLTAADALTISSGGHAHYNWGFTTQGVYRAYFRVSGVRTGDTTNTSSAETPFTFHVQPLRPYENWTATNWPCECAINVIAAAADPDGDRIPNLLEYAVGNDPKTALPANLPALTFVDDGGMEYGAIRLRRSLAATDVSLAAYASDFPGEPREQLTNTVSVVRWGATESITVRDSRPKAGVLHRFFEVRAKLDYP